MLKPEVLKCHEDLSTLETGMYNKEKHWIISSTYVKTLSSTYVKTLTSLGIWGPGEGGGGASIIRLGPSWFTSTLYLIIIYMSNIEAI